mgnify:CR=1 FL=1
MLSSISFPIKILNNLTVTGTGSNSQALGITAGYVGISNRLSVGTWNLPSDTDFYILSGSTSTYPLRVRNNANNTDLIK